MVLRRFHGPFVNDFGSFNMLFLSIFAGKYDIQCGKASLDKPFIPISTCVRMKQAVRLLTT
jgi:hypothetical protein